MVESTRSHQLVPMMHRLLALTVFWWRRLAWLLRGAPRISRADTPTSNDRTIRLFVSSTFQDMQDERQVLQRDVFPIVRRHLWERGITFIHVDLRWGVTREEAERGEVLDICLREIDRCRPWLIGMLGARYGWCDPGARERLTNDPVFARLAPHADASVTELELRHAITERPLLAPEPAGLIYWRTDPADAPFKSVAADIEATGLSVRRTDRDLQAFAETLRDDLLGLVEARMPHKVTLSGAQFLARRKIEESRNSFVDRPEASYLHMLAGGSEGRYALIGSEGCGKSAVMSATARSIEAEGRVKLVAAFAPGGFRNWSGAFKSVLAQVGDQQGRVAAGPGELAQQFHNALGAAAALTPLCVLFDDVEADTSWPP